jgi:TRAP-type mannitol/chloroaromatic compound transport system permease large subunit
MPVFLPMVLKLGYDPVWFGILLCINMQLSFLSPPFGPAAFYLKSVAPPEISLIDIYRSFGPFLPAFSGAGARAVLPLARHGAAADEVA